MEETKTTINEEEINTFNKFADEWRTAMRSLEILNDVRIPVLIENLQQNGYITKEMSESEKPLLGLNILDIGCGGGLASEPLAKLGANVTGVDASQKLIDYAKVYAEANDTPDNLTYICDTIEHFSEKNQNKFDVLFASEVVEHVDELDLFIKSCIKTVKPKGAVYITTINRTMRSWLIAIILYEYILGFIQRGVHDWYKLVSPDEIKELLRKNDCNIIRTSGWKYSYLSGKYTLCEDTSVFFYTFAIKD